MAEIEAGDIGSPDIPVSITDGNEEPTPEDTAKEKGTGNKALRRNPPGSRKNKK